MLEYTKHLLKLKKHWLFKLEEDYSFKSEKVCIQLKEDLEFRDESYELRLEIKQDGTIIVKKGYAWDGCSPKLSIFDLFWLGTPDGGLKEGKPITYYASLVHDALGQFCEENDIPFNRSQRDLIFKEMLEQKDFKLASIYYLAIRIFGSFYSALT
jgi:hypothetical protein